MIKPDVQPYIETQGRRPVLLLLRIEESLGVWKKHAASRSFLATAQFLSTIGINSQSQKTWTKQR